MTRHEKLQEVLDMIDENIGFGPDEVLTESHDVDQFISDFLVKAKKYSIYKDYFETLFEDESESWAEMLNEV